MNSVSIFAFFILLLVTGCRSQSDQPSICEIPSYVDNGLNARIDTFFTSNQIMYTMFRSGENVSDLSCIFFRSGEVGSGKFHVQREYKKSNQVVREPYWGYFVQIPRPPGVSPATRTVLRLSDMLENSKHVNSVATAYVEGDCAIFFVCEMRGDMEATYYELVLKKPLNSPEEIEKTHKICYQRYINLANGRDMLLLLYTNSCRN